jgi:hypothetical protein
MKKLLKALPAVLVAMGFASVLSSCDRYDRERAHQKLERGIDKAGEKIERAGERMQEKSDPD